MTSNLCFSLLSSGSKANSIYVSDGETKVLIDCGLSCRQTVKRLEVIGVDASEIDAILVTHEHSDHVAGVGIFHRKFQTRVYANQATRNASSKLLEVPEEFFVPFFVDCKFNIGGLSFDPFPTEHDAADPVAFRISGGGKDLAIVTDLGQKTNYVSEKIKGVNALILEANHDLDMLYDAPYPWSVKQRIQSRKGHLKNEQAAELLVEEGNGLLDSLQVVVAAHISEKSNTPAKATQVLRDAWLRAGGRSCQKFIAADALEPTELFYIV